MELIKLGLSFTAANENTPFSSTVFSSPQASSNELNCIKHKCTNDLWLVGIDRNGD